MLVCLYVALLFLFSPLRDQRFSSSFIFYSKNKIVPVIIYGSATCFHPRHTLTATKVCSVCRRGVVDLIWGWNMILLSGWKKNAALCYGIEMVWQRLPQHRALKSTISLFFFVTFHSQREDFVFSHCEVEAQAQSHRRVRRLMQPVHCLWWWSFGLLIYLIIPPTLQVFLSEICRINVLS